MLHELETLTVAKGIYQHYKGHRYQVIGAAHHSENLEVLVVYQALERPNDIWVRPVSMFFDTVQTRGGPTPRFALIEPDFAYPAHDADHETKQTAYETPDRFRPQLDHCMTPDIESRVTDRSIGPSWFQRVVSSIQLALR